MPATPPNPPQRKLPFMRRYPTLWLPLVILGHPAGFVVLYLTIWMVLLFSVRWN